MKWKNGGNSHLRIVPFKGIQLTFGDLGEGINEMRAELGIDIGYGILAPAFAILSPVGEVAHEHRAVDGCCKVRRFEEIYRSCTCCLLNAQCCWFVIPSYYV